MGISLTKGQTISLSKEAPGLAKVCMGLGWDPVKKKSGFFGRLMGGGSDSIDLDASCLVFDTGKKLLDTVWFRQLRSKDGSIQHTGDNLTGDGDGDDEQIRVDLSRLPANATALVFTVNSFRGQTFNEVDNAVCRIVDETSNKELARYALNQQGNHTGVIMAVVSRENGAWHMKAIGAAMNGREASDMAGAAARFI
jgi:tellurium resistance protein TerZ